MRIAQITCKKLSYKMLEVQFNEIPDFNFLINELSGNAVNRCFKAFQAYRRSAINQQFAKEVDPYGTPQTPLSAAYEIVKRKRWGDKSILVASGKMKRTWNNQVDGIRYTEYFDSDIAQYHQTGTHRLPRRQMLPTSDQGLPRNEEAKLLTLVNDEITKSWGNLGSRAALQKLAQVTPDDVNSVLSDIANYANQ